ncbi:zinc finger MYM-type protein 1-like [Rhopalosiphum padi]|uniref:zinc finger MYM-type protein 1-like n=1 Tax=Rhopalosiphum padi TaxID=40932 RepID=UPI00298E6FAE|nr:zinc finger MYM-type protein 1-like [Rhopalosiphum padi]
MVKKHSGAFYRQKKKENASETAKVLAKTPKLYNYFQQNPPNLTRENVQNDNHSLSNDNAVSQHCSSAHSPDLTIDNKVNDLSRTEENHYIIDEVHENLVTVIPRDDPTLWIVNETTKDYFSFNGFNQNLENNDFSKSKRLSTKRMRGAQRSYYRYFSLKFIKTKLINNEPFNRTFLVYSNSTGNVYCAPCRLFGSKSVFATVGFSNWKKGEEKISQHENSISHKSCVLKMSQRGSVLERIDKQLILQVETEKMYWEKVLTRVAAVVKSLSSRGLPLRGHDDKFGSTHSGNFIMSLELIAEFDPFLSNHIAQYANKGKGSTSYLSFATFEQFVYIMAEKVKETIVNEIKDAKYFSIVVDSTPDISHTDQLSLIFRYVKKNGEPVERFLQFFANAGHKSEDMADAIFMALGANDLNIKNCRGQSYDNASNMSGMYSGLQARIKEACIHAVYIPCAAHSLNLVGECAASCCTQRLSDTRWSARHDACLSLSRNWNEIIKALNIIIHSSTEKSTTKCEAKGLLKNLKSLEMGILTTLWNDILERFNCISKKLQSVHIDLTTVVTLYKSLIYYIQDLRNSFAFYEKLGKEKSGVD